MSTFSAAERRLARALLAAYPSAGLEPVAKLSARGGVSSPTALRFVGRLGYGGYPEFQDVLRAEIQERLSGPPARYAGVNPDTAGDVVSAGFDRLDAILRQTRDALSRSEFDAVVAMLADARLPVHCLGGRHSQVFARYLALGLRELRPGVELLPDGHSAPITATNDLGRRDVVVLFDYRRHQRDTLNFARAASDRGATVILFTDLWQSPVTEVARHVLVAPVGFLPPFDSMIGCAATVELLLTAVAARVGTAGQRRMTALDGLTHAKEQVETEVKSKLPGGKRRTPGSV
jgi:DNA-binding MurR/RpiR family transcriptional regulator